jgi:outer membrane lipoprotein carrier protein
MRPLRLACLALALLLAAPAAACAQDAAPTAADAGAALLQRVQARYEAAGTLVALFTQTVRTDLASDQAQRLRGRLTAATGNRFRVETARETIVSDGATTWIYNQAEGQVIVNDYDASEATFSPEDFFRDFSARYGVTDAADETRDGAPHTVLTLGPASPETAFRRLRLWIRDADRVITRLELDDRTGAAVTFALDDVRLGAELPPGTFAFDPPADADVVDLREAGE